MNRIILLFLISAAFLIFEAASAQKHPQFRYISLDAGFNMAGIRSSGDYDKHQKNFGVNISLSGNYSFSELNSLGAGLIFDQKGAVDNVYDIHTNLNYLTLPVYSKWVIGKDPGMFITAGIYAAWLLNAGMRGEQVVNGQIIHIKENVTDNFRHFDAGLALSAGMMVRLYDDFDFLVTIRGTSGMLKIESSSGYRPRNYHINISLGYIYYIGNR